jgi:hypothetical protein
LILKGLLGTGIASIFKKRVAGAVIGASYKPTGGLRARVRGVIGRIGGIGRSSIRISVIGARQHLAIAIALDLAALLALIIASACSFVFRSPLEVRRRGHLRSSAG